MTMRQISAFVKAHMDVILATLGLPPNWIDDLIIDDSIFDAESELRIPEGFAMHRPTPGSSESHLSECSGCIRPVYHRCNNHS